ncbi:putative sodium-dependent multivitamin transporter [Operophtera brumata]|uniref:Putative sodium-dependent multivitamin transporter n=1 Tax=Operophtera brumata TaxID=104452 RepID=A0A0L7LLE5_OPEBR|nr:putative sodium-dependent multivitamin transporter [Operophtera brumata]
MASFMSAITLLGVSAETYYYGMQFIVINISYGIATPIASRLYLPVFFGLQKTSTYEYLELRFGPHIRMLASLTYTLQMVLYNGIVLYAPAIVLEAVTGLDRLISILVVGLVCTFYSTLGGMKAVLFTDLLQSLLMFGAVFSVVQRLLTVKTLEQSQKCLWWSWPVLSVLSFATCLSGIGMFAVYKDCDPFTSHEIAALAACAYGLVFLALAFLAEYLGGILQAALTIFGAVGGPLFGVFTLGMFTTYANQRGVSIGLLTGMAVTLWISFGGPRPMAEKLPLSVEGCGFNVTRTPTAISNPGDYLYPYRVSYLWTRSVVSVAWRQQQPWEREGREHPDPALFTPPLARVLRQRFGDKQAQEYLLADRNQSTLPVAVSLMASFMSAITLLGVSAENYYFGMMFFIMNIGYLIGTPIASRLYLPVFFGLQKTSTYEYLELRFGPRIRVLASLTYSVQMILYSGVVLYAPAIVLESVTGLDRLVSILLVGLVCTFYSTLGGMKAVLYTDLLQSLLMFAAVFAVLVFTSMDLGGFDKIFVIAREGGRLDFSSISIDPTERHTWWALLLAGTITFLSLYAVNQTQVQRLLTVSTLEQSQNCLWWSWPVLAALSLVTCISGLGMYAVYRECDPYTSGSISAIDQLMPYYVVDAMRAVPGLAGLFVAGIFSASLSTVSSSCNSLAAVTLADYISRWCKVKDAYIMWLTKILACVYGLVFLTMAYLAQYLGGILQASLTIFGAVGGPVLGVFTLGMFTTFANELGVSVALVSGIALTLWINLGGPRPAAVRLPLSVEGCAFNVTLPAPVVTDPSDYFYLYRISYLWTSPIGLVWVLLVGSVVSLLWRHKQPWEREGKDHPDPALFTPPLARRLRARMNFRQ